ncbi:unnamed protein product [Effrenium voratum]|uniref:DNA2/NAM7 helicase helicase domain-containing protein n=1 Tax=Effrenium voratum TaxID=2562239 RepID=A0AA36HMK2_9DINO|nr:unnamed protein product [Effrenium voratum]
MRKRARLALLQARMPWLQPSFVPFTDQDWQEVSRRSRTPFSKEVKIKEVSKTAETEVPQKVLVCGPSNASIDEVLRRIDRDGIVDVRGERDRPFMLRMGPNCHPDVEEYSIKRMVDKRLKAS